ARQPLRLRQTVMGWRFLKDFLRHLAVQAVGADDDLGEQVGLGAGEMLVSFPTIPSGADSRDETESAHHPARCLPSSICLGRLSPTYSSRDAGLKSRTSFSGISSILL